ncbi:MAG: hypothetical protein HDR28_01485 [Lachnospiraceae bacterium]|nr:hypothetical protein [Lachnospiraceae bacterium]
MTNVFFENEEVAEDDLFFLCYMIERVARKLHQRNKYVVNQISETEWMRLISLADVLHCENPEKVEDEWIQEYELLSGEFDVSNVDSELVKEIPSATQMGKVYMRLIIDMMQRDENYIDGMIRVYNNELCETLDNYNCGAYYEPSYFIARAYINGGF